MINFVVLLLFSYVSSQSVPFYDTAKSIYVSGNTVLMTSDVTDYTVTFPTGFTISTLNYRKPFIAVHSTQNFVFQNSKVLQFLARVLSFTSTSMIVEIQNYVLTDTWGTITDDFGFRIGKNVKFRYLIIKSTFPSIYYCNSINATVNFTILASSSQQLTFNMNTMATPAPLLFGNQTVFLHTFTDCWLNQTTSPWISSFQMKFSFTIVNSSQFKLTVSSKYGVKTQMFSIMIFIYNKDQFQSYYIRMQYQYLTFSNLNLGSTILNQIYTSSFLPGTTSFFYGVSGYEFNGYTQIGYQFSIGANATGNNYTISLRNLFTTSAVPRLDILVLVTGQIRCPNNQTLMNELNDTCYSPTCPSHTYKSTQQYGITGIFMCKTCIPTCLQCSITASNCTVCDSTLNRILSNSSCMPISHYFDDGINVPAQPCDLNCNQCSKLSTNCTSCYSGLYLNLATNSCVLCNSTYGVQCLTCNSTKCLSCISTYILNQTNCISCTFFHAQCNQCNTTNCTQCNVGFYLINSTCLPCSNYHSQCLECSSVSCTLCNSSYIVSINGSCVVCSDYHSQCLTCSNASCTICSSDYFQTGITCQSCTIYHSQCITCTPTSCSNCSSPYIVSVNGSCVNCSDYHLQCQICNGSSCQICSIGYYQKNTSCDSCTFYHSQCEQCNSTSCTLCTSPYIVSLNGSCVRCSDYHLECNTCDPSTCTACNTLFAVSGISCLSCLTYHLQCNQCTATTCQACNSGFFLTGTTCQSCSPTYNTQCLTCNSTQCFTCQNSYFVNQTDYKCYIVSCGDGVWVETIQTCDDGNFDDNDGCDSQCQVETDFQCLIVDKLPSGASSCKYTKNITVNFGYLQKDLTSNTVHLFFDLQPTTFKDWNTQTIQSMLSPIQIVDSKTGTAQLVPINNMNIILNQNTQTGQIQVVIDYGQSNLQNSFLRFNIDPSKTNISYISSIPPNNDIYLQLSSVDSGVYLYGYSQDVYEFQTLIQSLGNIIGLISLGFMMVGFFVPAGKLIVLEALAVVQITYFSILQFDKVSPTFAGFKGLLLSSGYNDPNMFSSSSSKGQMSIYKMMGLQNGILSNYNLSLIALFILPLIIGLIGKLLTRTVKLKPDSSQNQQLKKQTQQEQDLNLQLTSNHKKKLLNIIFSRIFYEYSLYGFIICGYLQWMSGLKSLNSFSLINIVSLGTLAAIWIVQSVLLIQKNTQTINLNQFIQKIHKKQQINKSEKFQILTNFGEFKSVNQQITMNNNPKQKTIFTNFYIPLIIQRFLFSCIVLFLPSMFKLSQGAIIAIYLTLIIALNLSYQKYQKLLSQTNRKGIFSYLYQNYVLRQTINFVTIIIIETLYLIQTMLTQNNYQNLTKNSLTVKLIPISILGIVSLNLGFNMFLWVWELKQQKIISKCKLVMSAFFPSLLQKPEIVKNNYFEQSIVQEVQPDNSARKELLKKPQHEQQQMTNLLASYFKNSPLFQNRASPFLNVQEKRTRKDSIMSLFRLQQPQNESVVDNIRNNPMLQQPVDLDVWDQI